MENKTFKKQIGIFSALLIALGSTIGTGIFATYGDTLIRTECALILVIGGIIAGLITIPTLMVQAEMISAYPEAGGPYIFFKKARLKPAAFMYGGCYGIGGGPISTAFKAVMAFEFLEMFFIRNDGFGTMKLLAFLTILIFGAINYFSLKGGALTNNIITSIKIILLVVLIIILFTSFDSANFETRVAERFLNNRSQFSIGVTGLSGAIALSLGSYNGINNVAYMANEVKKPRISVPIVMLATVIITIAIYVLFVIAMSGLLSASAANDLVKKDTPVAYLTLKAIGNINNTSISKLFQVIVVLLCIGSVFTATKYAPRLPYAMAKDQLFFHSFAKISKKGSTPNVAILFNTILAALITLLPFMRISNSAFIISYFTFGASLMNLFIVLTIIRCGKNNDYHPRYKMRGPKITLAFAIIATIIAASSGMFMAFKDISTTGYLLFAPLSCLTVMISAYPVYHFGTKYYHQQTQKITT